MKRLVAAYVVLAAVQVSADDWPQWRGADRSDRSTETDLLDSWPEEGPKQLWRFENAGAGYAGPSIVGGVLFTMGDRDGTTCVIALDAETGEERWTRPISDSYQNAWGNGPRSTPTYDNGMVYALSGDGTLTCIAADTGEQRWVVRFVDDLGGRVPKWGYSESVLVDGDNVVCTPGGDRGAITALNKLTGEVVWRSECTEPAQYSSIVPTDRDGVRQYIQLFMSRLVSVSPSDGSTLWEMDFPGRIAVIPTPIVDENRVYITAGYGTGCAMAEFDGDSVNEVYANKVMKNHHGGVILKDGRLFGHSDKLGWVCQDFETGKLVWRDRRSLDKGCVAYADGKLYCVGEDSGEVVLVSAVEEKWQERGRFLLQPQTKIRKKMGKIWTHPVICNGRLYLRDQDLIYCYDIRGQN